MHDENNKVSGSRPSMNDSTFAVLSAREAAESDNSKITEEFKKWKFKPQWTYEHCFVNGILDQSCKNSVSSFSFKDMCMQCNGDWNDFRAEAKRTQDIIDNHPTSSCRTTCYAETCKGGTSSTPGCDEYYWALEHGKSSDWDQGGTVCPIGESYHATDDERCVSAADATSLQAKSFAAHQANGKHSPSKIWDVIVADTAQFGGACQDCH
jgi:hypothetical protein